MANHTEASRFLQAVFPDHAEHAIFANLHPPAATRDYTALDGTRDCYWSVAAFDRGHLSRTTDKALEVRALVIDDVGTKVKGPAVLGAIGAPTAVVETSAGNYQWVYRLDPAVPVADWARFFASVEFLVGTKLEGRDAVHLFRLPMGVNTKKGRGGFKVRLAEAIQGLAMDPATVDPVQVARSSTAGSVGGGDMDIKKLRALMALIPNDLDDRGEWIEVAHGLKALCENDADGLVVFDEWSAGHASYDAEETRRVWDSLGTGGLRSKGGRLRARAEGSNPQGFASLVFDDDPPPPPPPPAAPVAGALPTHPTHWSMSADVSRAERGRLGWINGAAGSWAMFDPVMLRWVISTNEAALHEAVRESISRHLLGTDPKMTAQLLKAGWHHAVASLVRLRPSLCLERDAFDANRDLLGLPGFVLEMDAMGLGVTGRPGAPKDFVTRSTSTKIAPAGAKGKYWEKFLDDFTQKDPELRRWWQVFCGYCLSGHTSEHVVVFVYGPGGNGKSVFLDMIGEVMGDYHERADHRVFMDSKGGKHLAPLAVLEGARLVTVPDVAVGATWDMGLVKQASGGGAITANRMRQDPTTFVPQFKIVMAGNEKPRLDTVDDGVRRRMRLVPALFRPKAVDVGLVDKLRGEKAEILRWMVDGWVGWAAGGLPACRAIHDATEEYLDNADVFGRWRKEFIMDVGGRVAVKDRVYVGEAFKTWEAFREDNKSHATGPHTSQELGTKLREGGYVVDRDRHGKYIEGVALKTKPKKVF